MSERSEAPTSRRINEAREQGQVARSMELNSAAVLLFGVLIIKSLGANMVNALKETILAAFSAAPTAELTDAFLTTSMLNTVSTIVPAVAPIMLLLMVLGVAVTLAQTQFLWSSKRMRPDLTRLNPLTGLKRMFSPQSLVELLKALLKLGLIGFVAYSYLRGNIQHLMELSQFDLLTGMQVFMDMVFSLSLRAGGAYLVLAIADYVYQRWQYMRGLRMTKEEIKEELKQSEGDPFIRSRIRSQQRRIARMRMMANVHKATVVITNPTHLAIAIEYDGARMQAPRVLAKGAYIVAEKIVALARQNNIPVIQNIPLARAMYKTVEIDHEISPELYTAMAEVLAYVYRMRGLTPASNRA